jgi:hypothetical protein
MSINPISKPNLASSHSHVTISYTENRRVGVVPFTLRLLYPKKTTPRTHRIRCVGPGKGVDVLEKRKISCLYLE